MWGSLGAQEFSSSKRPVRFNFQLTTNKPSQRAFRIWFLLRKPAQIILTWRKGRPNKTGLKLVDPPIPYQRLFLRFSGLPGAKKESFDLLQRPGTPPFRGRGSGGEGVTRSR